MSKIKFNNINVSRNYPHDYQKKVMSPYQDLYFSAMNILQDEILPVESH